MKQLFLLAVMVLFNLNLFSQSNIQMGALGVFSRTTGKGAEIAGNVRQQKIYLSA